MGPTFAIGFNVVGNAAQKLNQILGAQTQLNNAMGRAQQIGAATLTQTQAATRATTQHASSLRQAAAAFNIFGGAAKSTHITFLGMLKVMLEFGIALQLIRAMTSPYGFLRSAIQEGARYTDILAKTNALLRLNNEDLQRYGVNARKIAVEYGHTVDDVLTAGREIASSISSLNTGQLSESAAVLEVVRQAARGAAIDGSSLTGVANALISTMAAMQIPVERSTEVLNYLFATVDVGRTTFEEAGEQIGGFLGILATMAPTNPEERLRFLRETLAMFATLSNVVPVPEAATGVERILTSLTKEADQVFQLREALTAATGVPLDIQFFTEKGPMAWFQNLTTAIGRESDLVQGLIGGQLDPDTITPAQEEAMASATSTRLLANLFPNIRASRPLAVFLQDAGATLREIMGDFDDSVGKADLALKNAMNNAETQLDRIKAIWQSFKISLSLPLLNEFTSAFQLLADNLDSIVNAEGFDQLSAPQKVRAMMDGFVDTLNHWWDTGGQTKVSAFSDQLIDSMIIFMEESIDTFAPKLFDIGEDIARHLFTGFLEYAVKNPLSPIVAGLGLWAMFPKLGPFRAMGAAFVGEQALGGLPGPASGGDIGGDLLNTIMSGAFLYSLFRNRGGGGPGGNVIGGISRMPGMATPGTVGWRTNGTTGAQQPINMATGQFAPNTPGNRAGAMATNIGITGLNAASLWAALRRPRATGGMLRAFGGTALGGLGRAVGITGAALFGIDQVARMTGEGSLGDLFNMSVRNKPNPGAAGFGQASAQQAMAQAQNIDDLVAMASQARNPDAINQLDIFGFGVDKDSWQADIARKIFPLSTQTAERNANKAAEVAYGAIEPEVYRAFGLDPATMPAGILGPILENARQFGIPEDQLGRFVAFNLGVIREESNFNPRANPIDSNGVRSTGLYQLNQLGQGAGIPPSALMDPTLNASIGSYHTARSWVQYFDPNDPNSIFKVSQHAGHPGVSNDPEAVANTQKIVRAYNEFYTGQVQQNEFGAIANNGLTEGSARGVTINTENFNVTLAGDPNSARVWLSGVLQDADSDTPNTQPESR